MSEKIREYWNTRARDSGGESSGTTNDIHLRRLEHRSLVEVLQSLVADGAGALDLGCGDGLTTLRVAQDVPSLRVLGIDYAEAMIANAAANLEHAPPGVQQRVRFRTGDAVRLHEAVGDETFDLVLTDRCLINLDGADRQYETLAQIAACLRPGGHYVGIENFMEGQEELNRARRSVGLDPIPVRWHNCYFREKEFLARTASSFRLVEFRHFASSYYLATRVVYSGACQAMGEEPDYDHPIHRLAPELPWTGRFSPIRMVILEKTS